MTTAYPLGRTLQKGISGHDVVAVQRALYRVGIRKYKSFGLYGDGMVAQVKELQRRREIPQSGIYGAVTHDHFVKGTNSHGKVVGKNPFDAYGKSLLKQTYNKLHPKTNKRDLIVQAAFSSYHNRAHTVYSGPGSAHIGQRMSWLQGTKSISRPPTYIDCSSMAEWCYWVSNAPSPSGSYGWATTYTQLPHGRRINIAQARPGDLIFYGNNSHVAVYVGKGMVVSNGSPGGPRYYAYNYRRDVLAICTYAGVDVYV